MQTNTVILQPVLTEKSSQMAQNKVYAFVVHEDANKYQVGKALEDMYKVKVAQVRIQVRHGKLRRVGNKMQSKRLSDKKIAYVTLKEGKIDLFPQA